MSDLIETDLKPFQALGRNASLARAFFGQWAVAIGCDARITAIDSDAVAKKIKRDCFHWKIVSSP